MFLEVLTEWWGTDIERSQCWNSKGDGDGKEECAFAEVLVSDHGQQSNAQATDSQGPIDEEKYHGEDPGQRGPLDTHLEVFGGDPLAVEGAFCGVDNECINVQDVVVIRSKDWLVKPVPGIHGRSDINRTGVDVQLMIL